MKESILQNLDNPVQLEELYRSNKTAFKRSFLELYPSRPTSTVAICWYERFQEETSSIAWGKGADLLFILIASLVATFIAKKSRNQRTCYFYREKLFLHDFIHDILDFYNDFIYDIGRF